MYRSLIPSPTNNQAGMTNEFLAQLNEAYATLVYRRWFFTEIPPQVTLRLLLFSDASGNSRPGNYPQLCFTLYLPWVDNSCVIEVDMRSYKSDRVTKGTAGGETLAMVKKGTECAFKWQEWFSKVTIMFSSRGPC